MLWWAGLWSASPGRALGLTLLGGEVWVSNLGMARNHLPTPLLSSHQGALPEGQRVGPTGTPTTWGIVSEALHCPAWACLSSLGPTAGSPAPNDSWLPKSVTPCHASMPLPMLCSLAGMPSLAIKIISIQRKLSRVRREELAPW